MTKSTTPRSRCDDPQYVAAAQIAYIRAVAKFAAHYRDYPAYLVSPGPKLQTRSSSKFG